MDGNKQEAALGAGAAHSERSTLSLILFWHKNQNCLRSDCYRSPYRTRRRKVYQLRSDDESVIQGIKDAASFAPLHNRLT